MVVNLCASADGARAVKLLFTGEPACYPGLCTDKGRCREVDGALFVLGLTGRAGWLFFLLAAPTGRGR